MELTSKQRAKLRGLANGMDAIFQIGKGGVTEELISQLELALEKRELIKITVLETAPVTAREAADALERPLRAETVQCIGRKIVLYRESHTNKQIELKK
ncbi:ribosome assembly RNA-binding protein YhbY [Christensenellaceae bacterium OttesenSCG-928-M15]|nr:ribosome assembly RNA-binding protein YhbY [Christensenellaceae bacterium OttesenSCG-928-M15]